jgi:hypothetical protein
MNQLKKINRKDITIADIQIDDEGTIYVRDILVNHVQKFRLSTSE